MSEPRAEVSLADVERVQYLLDNLKGVAKRAVEEAIKKSTFEVQAEVKKSIAGRGPEPQSVDTGRFLNSVRSESEGFEGKVFTGIDYAKYLEHGTSTISARRHFKNSLSRKQPEIYDRVSNAVVKAEAEVFKKGIKKIL